MTPIHPDATVRVTVAARGSRGIGAVARLLADRGPKKVAVGDR